MSFLESVSIITHTLFRKLRLSFDLMTFNPYHFLRIYFQVVGNGIAHGVLEVIAKTGEIVVNETSAEDNHTRSYEFCGASDCQDANVTSSNLELYTPSRSTLTILLLSLAAFSCAGLLLHCFLIPNIDMRGTYEKCTHVRHYSG